MWAFTPHRWAVLGQGCVRFRADTRPSFAMVEEQPLKGILQELESLEAAALGKCEI